MKVVPTEERHYEPKTPSDKPATAEAILFTPCFCLKQLKLFKIFLRFIFIHFSTASYTKCHKNKLNHRDLQMFNLFECILLF